VKGDHLTQTRTGSWTKRGERERSSQKEPKGRRNGKVEWKRTQLRRREIKPVSGSRFPFNLLGGDRDNTPIPQGKKKNSTRGRGNVLSRRKERCV